MPRELSNEPCELTFDDRISGDKITLYYRLPTTQERVKYTNGYVTRKAGKIVATIGELRMKAGAAVLLGFKTGAFTIPGKGLISSKPGEPNYDAGWKAAVRQFASDFIEMLAIQVFEAPMMRIEKPVIPELEILPQDEGEWPDSPGPAPDAKEDDWHDEAAPAPKAEGKEDLPL
jgi:hypothetical protein